MTRLGAHRELCAGMLALTVPLGLVWRLAPLHLPGFAFKYGGSALWAMAVYWAVALIMPRGSPARVAVVAAAISLAVELAKRVYWAPLDRFRETLTGKLLLGRYFSLGAIVAYWLAIVVAALIDSGLRRWFRGSTHDARVVRASPD